MSHERLDSSSVSCQIELLGLPLLQKALGSRLSSLASTQNAFSACGTGPVRLSTSQPLRPSLAQNSAGRPMNLFVCMLETWARSSGWTIYSTLLSSSSGTPCGLFCPAAETIEVDWSAQSRIAAS